MGGNNKIAGDWLFIFPVNNLDLTDSIGHEFKIGNVTFITAEKFYRAKSKFGVKLKKENLTSNYLTKEIIEKEKCILAVIRQNGFLDEARSLAEKEVKDKLFILIASQLSYVSKSSQSRPDLSHNHFYSTQHVTIKLNGENRFGGGFKSDGTVFPLRLDSDWERYHRSFYFLKAIKLFGKCSKDMNDWEKTLYRSFIFAGKSIAENDIGQAFIYRMTALECILTSGGKNHKESLIDTFRALIGWHEYWEDSKLSSKIESLYRDRNQYIHDGNSESITLEHLKITEMLLHNLYNNIFSNLKYFNSKASLKELIEIQNAIERLNLHSDKFKYLPKGLKFTRKI